MVSISKNLDAEVVYNAEGFISFVKIKEIDPVNDGSVFLTPREIEVLYKRIFGNNK